MEKRNSYLVAGWVIVLLIVLGVSYNNVVMNKDSSNKISFSATDQCGVGKFFICPTGYSQSDSSSTGRSEYIALNCGQDEYSLVGSLPYRSDSKNICSSTILHTGEFYSFKSSSTCQNYQFPNDAYDSDFHIVLDGICGDCSPGTEKCDSTTYSLCNSTGEWVSQGEVSGKCGYNPGGNNNDNSNGCTPRWRCGTWSDSVNSCGTRICTDSNRCNRNTNKPDELVSCSSALYCGDGTCNNGETSSTCTTDCAVVDTRCGDGTCNGDETSDSCSSDCELTPPCGDNLCDKENGETSSSCSKDCKKSSLQFKDLLWLWIILGALILILVAFIIVKLIVNRKTKIPSNKPVITPKKPPIPPNNSSM